MEDTFWLLRAFRANPCNAQPGCICIAFAKFLQALGTVLHAPPINTCSITDILLMRQPSGLADMREVHCDTPSQYRCALNSV